MSRPLRICITVAYDLAEEGGVRRHAEHLAHELRRLGDVVLLVGPYSGKNTLSRDVCGLSGVVAVASNGSNSRPGILVAPWQVWWILQQPFDVVHIMEPVVPSLNWYAAWFARSAVRVATFHSYSEKEPAAARFVRERFGRAQLGLFDRAIAVSPPAARFASGLWSRPLTLIPNGTATQVFSPALKEPSRTGLPIRLLFVGHWHNPRKGLATLLDAFARLRARAVPVTLDIVGDGRELARSRLPGITYHRAISDEMKLAEVYRSADVFVAPSLGQESFGIVLLEAMASGLPIICSDIDGYRSVVAQNGVRLVPPGDSRALASAIFGLADSPFVRRRMGEINRAEALNYDWSIIAGRIRQEYVAALDERRCAVEAEARPSSSHLTADGTRH